MIIVNGFEIFRDDSHFGMFVVRREGVFSNVDCRRFMSQAQAIEYAELGGENVDDGQGELEL